MRTFGDQIPFSTMTPELAFLQIPRKSTELSAWCKLIILIREGILWHRKTNNSEQRSENCGQRMLSCDISTQEEG